MQTMRQAAGGLIYAVLSIVLVLGSLSVALAERNASTPPAVAPSPTLIVPSPLPSFTPPAATDNATVSNTSTATSIATGRQPSATVAANYPTVASTRRPATATHAATSACGPFPGWVKAYVVQPGDTMFHIAVLYQTTVTSLQRANCKTNYLIFAGERLWVPNVATATAGVTIIPPFFDTPTDEATQVVATDTPPYCTPTSAPTDTSTPADP